MLSVAVFLWRSLFQFNSEGEVQKPHLHLRRAETENNFMGDLAEKLSDNNNFCESCCLETLHSLGI